MNTNQPSTTDQEAAVWLFENLMIVNGRSADRAHIRRSVDEAAHRWQTQDQWWKWIIDASKSLSLKGKVVDCTTHQLSDLVREGAQVFTRVGKEGHWNGVVSSRSGKFLVLQALKDKNQVRVGRRRLKQLLETTNKDDLIRCVAFEPQLNETISQATDDHNLTPLRRLLALLRPEINDIWIVVIFALVTGFLALATPLAVDMLVTNVAFGRLIQPVVVLALMLLAFLSFNSALKVLQTFVVEIIQRRMFARVAADLAFRLPRVEFKAMEGQYGRELVNRFFDIVTVQKVSAQLLLDGISLVIGTLIGMAVLAFYHPFLLGFDVVLLALIAFTIFVLGRGAITTSQKESKTKYHMAAWLQGLVASPTAFRHSGAAEFALDRTDRLIYDYLTARKKHFRIILRQITFALGLQAFASTMLLGLGGWLVILGELTLGQLVAAELIVTVIVGSFAKIGKHMESYYDLLAAVDKLGVLFDLPMEKHGGLLQLDSQGSSDIEIRNVSCKAGVNRLNSFDLAVEAGERIALCGSADCGKELILDLIYGLRTPDTGHVLVSGTDPRDMRPDALRRPVTLIRDIEIIHGTIAENVHLERPDVSTGDVRDALEKLGLFEELLLLPDGLETELCEDGYPLTKSQLRRLMIARGIVGRPSLLMIDGLLDALSDDELEVIAPFLTSSHHPWTLLLVSGRQSLLDQMNRVISVGELSISDRRTSYADNA